MMSDDNDVQMIFEDLGGLKLPDISLTDEDHHLILFVVVVPAI